jgi:hypothetical protein
MWEPANTLFQRATGSGSEGPPADQQGCTQRQEQMNHAWLGPQDEGQEHPQSQRREGQQQDRKLHTVSPAIRLTVEQRVSILMPGER